MGEIYRADDLTLDQPVALKFLPDGTSRDTTRLAQFHNELRVARQVSHKHVCRLYDLGEADGRRFLTMEYIDGDDLGTLLRRIGRFPQDRAVTIARQLCAGVAAAHDRGVIHRDLKPANVMIDRDGNVRIADFGIATGVALRDVPLAGTPQYMAPEQLTGTPASIATDIYSLGLVLFEIFTGKRVHEAETFAELRALHDTGTVPTPSAIVRDLDPAVERVILRCLDADARKRPPSALTVAAALPGGQPLEEVLASGLTPSPQLLASIAESGGDAALAGAGGRACGGRRRGPLCGDGARGDAGAAGPARPAAGGARRSSGADSRVGRICRPARRHRGGLCRIERLPVVDARRPIRVPSDGSGCRQVRRSSIGIGPARASWCRDRLPCAPRWPTRRPRSPACRRWYSTRAAGSCC